MSKYFTEDEMRCKCGCGQCKMNEHFMDLLDSLRAAIGKPLVVTSGYRCPEHDKAIGGSGNHTTGFAVDLSVTDSNLRYLVVKTALELGFTRIGVARAFIHLDRVFDKPQKVFWIY